MFSKILIANRGEIALRIMRTCKEMGIKTVAVYSTADVNSLHIRMADESVCIGDPHPKDSYLKMDNLISAADITGVDAIHPGVGFLSENPHFAAMVKEHGITFIGPSPEHIGIMADKISAKKAVQALGLPTVPGSKDKVESIEQARTIANDIGFPLLIKAANGGGGKGMQVVHAMHQLENAINIAQIEAQASFGDKSVFIEKYLENPRHIEVQILGDQFGRAIHLGERDCSIQRRHQKIWEEAPSPALSEEERYRLGQLSVQAIEKLGYSGVGTLEFLYENGQFYFIEMNTRIQVEHPITEMITGVDLIKQQILMAAGKKLMLKQDDIKIRGHAIECRINAEHSETFMPSPGKISFYHPPGGMGVRVDSHIYQGYQIPPFYDSLIAKLIAYGADRESCMTTLERALEEYVIDGVDTLLPLHKQIVRHPDMRAGKYSIKWLERQLDAGIQKAVA